MKSQEEENTSNCGHTYRRPTVVLPVVRAPNRCVSWSEVEVPGQLALGMVRPQCGFRKLHSFLLHLLVLCLGSGRKLFEVAPA